MPPADDDTLPVPASAPGRWQRSLGHRYRGARWIGWRSRALVAAALFGCIGMLLLIRSMAAVPALPVLLQANDAGALTVVDAAGHLHVLKRLTDPSGHSTPLDSLLLQRSARWLVDDAQREHQATQQDALARALASGRVHLTLADGQVMAVTPRPHGASGLGAMFWFCATLALLLYLVSMHIVFV